jgi:hypothetical protein
MQAYFRTFYETNKKVIYGLPGDRFTKLPKLMWSYRNKPQLTAHQWSAVGRFYPFTARDSNVRFLKICHPHSPRRTWPKLAYLLIKFNDCSQQLVIAK